ncbi:hypothetical protein [Nocardia niwae]|uniref:hypothetical protein n=1 Tax=Nocardia niwae TaxID=626084 RepID=UPI0012F4B330|nr:hypothetical protein [Nocardia niwae]
MRRKMPSAHAADRNVFPLSGDFAHIRAGGAMAEPTRTDPAIPGNGGSAGKEGAAPNYRNTETDDGVGDADTGTISRASEPCRLWIWRITGNLEFRDHTPAKPGETKP